MRQTTAILSNALMSDHMQDMQQIQRRSDQYIKIVNRPKAVSFIHSEAEGVQLPRATEGDKRIIFFIHNYLTLSNKVHIEILGRRNTHSLFKCSIEIG